MKTSQGPTGVRTWLVLFVVSLASIVQAEDVTITTYYPSPRGNYQTLNSTSQTNLATGTAATDRVGIGTTAPNAKLSIANNVATGFLDNYSEYQQILFDGGTAGSSYGFGIKGNTVVFNSGMGAYSFDRAGNAAAMVIDTSGNVGIGIPTPGAKLDIRAAGDDDSPVIRMRQSNAPDYGIDMGIDNNLNGGLVFRTVNAGVSAPAVTIHRGNGYVGIGTTDPGQSLDVVGGYARSDTGFCIGASCITSWSAGGGVTGSGTATQVAFWDTGSSLSSSANLYWDNTNARLGIGTAGPADKLDVQGNVILGAGTFDSGAIVDIGNVGANYPGNAGWAGAWNSNILLSGLDSTSISFHDSAARVDTLRVAGGQFHIGEDVGWGPGDLFVAGSRVCTAGNYTTVCPSTGGPAVVKSLEGIAMGGAGSVDLIPGTNITSITTSGDTITINASGGGGGVTDSSKSCPGQALQSFDVNVVDGEGCVAVGGGGVSGGTDNYIPRWNGSSALESSVVYQTDAGNVGIGETGPLAKLHTVGPIRVDSLDSTTTASIELHRRGTNTSWSMILGSAASAPLVFTGCNPGPSCTNAVRFTQAGEIIAIVKPFAIPHPLDPKNKYLMHAAIEGPENAVYYRGNAKLVNGEATVSLPDYFEALTRKEDRTVQLTPIGGWSPLYVVKQGDGAIIVDGHFVIRTTEVGNSSQEFSWEVKAVRADIPPRQVEVPAGDFQP